MVSMAYHVVLYRDGKMGEDLTTNCILEANGNVDIATGYNHGKTGNKPLKVFIAFNLVFTKYCCRTRSAFLI